MNTYIHTHSHTRAYTYCLWFSKGAIFQCLYIYIYIYIYIYTYIYILFIYLAPHTLEYKILRVFEFLTLLATLVLSSSSSYITFQHCLLIIWKRGALELFYVHMLA